MSRRVESLTNLFSVRTLSSRRRPRLNLGVAPWDLFAKNVQEPKTMKMLNRFLASPRSQDTPIIIGASTPQNRTVFRHCGERLLSSVLSLSRFGQALLLQLLLLYAFCCFVCRHLGFCFSGTLQTRAFSVASSTLHSLTLRGARVSTVAYFRSGRAKFDQTAHLRLP